MTVATNVTEYKTIDEFPARTSFTSLGLALLYVHDNNQVADVNKPCTITVTALQNLIAASASVNQDGTILKVASNGTYTTFIPSANTDAARGTAYLNALAAMADNDLIVLGRGYTYTISSNAEVTLGGGFIYGNGATVKAANGFNLGYLLHVTADPDTRVYVSDLTGDANKAGVSMSGLARGETFRFSGDGEVYANNLVGKNGPNWSTAAHFFLEGLGVKKLTNCVSDDPGHVSYRLVAAHNHLYNCDSIIYSYSGDYARHAECDSQVGLTNIKTIIWNGFLWKNDAGAMKINANFDPSNDGSYKAEEIMLLNGTMDFGVDHTDTAPVPDAFVKFDDCKRVLVANCTQRHSALGTVYTTKKWDVINFDSVDEAYVLGCTFDGGIKGAGTSLYVNHLTVDSCIFGRNAYLSHAVWNCTHFNRIRFTNNTCRNLRGSGTTNFQCIFENSDGSHTTTQEIYVDGNRFETNWSTTNGVLFRNVKKPGNVRVGKNTFVDSGLATRAAFSSSQRLLATADVGGTNRLYLTRNVIGSSRVALGNEDTYGEIHPLPVKPATAGGDWFAAYVSYGLSGVDGWEIVNENYGQGGNTWPRRWLCNAGNAWVSDEWYSTRNIRALTGATTLTAADSGETTITNEGATARVDITLPTAAAGGKFSFYVQDADGIRVIAATGDTVRIVGSVSATAGNATSTTVGSYATFEAINATEWVATSSGGTWTVT